MTGGQAVPTRVRVRPAAVVVAVLVLLVLLLAGGQWRQWRAAAPCGRDEPALSCYRRGLAAAATAVDSGRAPRGSGVRARLQERAQGLMRASCDRGHAPACYALARQLVIAAVDDSAAWREAGDLYAAGCLRESDAACNGLGEAYAYGAGRLRNPALARESFQRGCDLGHPTACYRASRRVEEEALELGMERHERARTLAALACDRGSVNGCIRHALTLADVLEGMPPQALREPGNAARHEFIVTTFRQSCREGFAVGCSNLGALFGDTVLGFPPSRDSAGHYYRLGCYPQIVGARGHGAACRKLGDLLRDSADTIARRDSLRNPARRDSLLNAALALYDEGCGMLAPAACAMLARAAAEAEDLGMSPARAALLAATACLQRNTEGCSVAGWIYGGPHLPDKEAARWFLARGCELGDPLPCEQLGTQMSMNASGSEDQPPAIKFYRRACDLPRGEEGCRQLLRELDFTSVGPSECLRRSPASAARLRCGSLPSRRGRQAVGHTVRGTLAAGDAVLYDGSRYDEWRVAARGGERLRIELRSRDFDALLVVGRLRDGRFVELSANDDADGGTTDAEVVVMAPETGDLVLRVNTFGPLPSGAYEMSVQSASPAGPGAPRR